MCRVSPPVRVFQLPALLPIPDLTQSHSIAVVQGELLIVSTKHRSRSHSIPISFDRPFKARALGSSPSRLSTSYEKQNLRSVTPLSHVSECPQPAPLAETIPLTPSLSLYGKGWSEGMVENPNQHSRLRSARTPPAPFRTALQPHFGFTEMGVQNLGASWPTFRVPSSCSQLCSASMR